MRADHFSYPGTVCPLPIQAYIRHFDDGFVVLAALTRRRSPPIRMLRLNCEQPCDVAAWHAVCVFF